MPHRTNAAVAPLTLGTEGLQLSYPNRKKLAFLLPELRPGDRVLDLGCGGMWLTRELRARGFDCIGVDVHPPADIVANVHDAGFPDDSFDVVIALEMLEHEDCSAEIARILRPGGTLVVSTPMPRWDWLLWLGEQFGACQPRQTPHSNLFELEELPFRLERRETIFGLVQLGIYRNEPRGSR